MQTGFVGLGAMGAHMARNLHRAGYLTGVWNRTADKAVALANELKCHAFSSLEELAGNCEAVVICVSADDDVRAVVAGLEPGLTPNMIVMDASTVGSATARDMHEPVSYTHLDVYKRQRLRYSPCPYQDGRRLHGGRSINDPP